jgi:hypothetical protein
MPNSNFNDSRSDDHSYDSEDDGDSQDYGSLESLIRAAGDCVHPSSDLRPRTLETARLRHRQQRRVSGVAIAALILAVLLPSGSGHREFGRWGESGQWGHLNLFSELSIPAISQSLKDPTSSDQPLSGTVHAGLDADWTMVDIFTQLRRQQAALLRGIRSSQ